MRRPTAAAVAELNASIEDVTHQRTFTALPVQSVRIEFVLRTRGTEHARQIVAALRADGIDAQRIEPTDR